MSRVRGRFYFKKTVSGNLLGEYSHRDGCTVNYPEAALRLSGGPVYPWEGKYRSTWWESETQSVQATLTIEAKDNCTNIFVLSWREITNGEPMFQGEAMLCDDLLVGDYND